MSRVRLTRLARQDLQDIGDYIIFYRPRRGGIEVMRIIHGKRDISKIVFSGFES